MGTRKLLCAFIVACVLGSVTEFARAETAVLAQTGGGSPDGHGTYDTFTDPVLNHFGNVAFRGMLSGVTVSTLEDQALFRVGSAGSTVVCREGDGMPDGNGTVYSLSTPAMNNGYDVVFRADATGTTLGAYDAVGIYRGTGSGSVMQIVRGNDPAPDGNGRFLVMSETPLVDDDMVMTFWASYTGTSGGTNDDTSVVLSGWGTTLIYARENQLVPGGDGRFSGFRHVTENDDQIVGFLGDMRNTSQGSDNNTAIFRKTFSAALTELAREGDAPPDGNGTYYSLAPSSTVDKIGDGRIAFRASLKNTSGGFTDDTGVFMGAGSGVYRIAREGDAPPGGNGQYDNFGTEISQNQTWVAYRAMLRNTSGGPLDAQGLYKGNGIVTREICRGGTAAPDGNGVFRWFSDPLMNDAGHVAFHATLEGTAGGTSDNEGLFVGNMYDTVQVARKGDAMLGSTIAELHMATGPDCRNGMNDLAQVAYRAVLANGKQALMLFTPEIQWKGGSGGWYALDHWTLGILPDEPYEVRIAPDHGPLEITGPTADVTVKSLSINSLNDGPATLNLNNGGGMTVLGDAQIGAKGCLLIGPNRSFSSGALQNDGLVEFEGGTAQVFGPVTLGAAGLVQMPTGTVAYFRGPVTNHGGINAAANATLHFFGLAGEGVAGGGKAHLDGPVEPGDGVGQMGFAGDVIFGPRSQTRIELGDIIPGGQHDRIVVAGNCQLGGGLETMVIHPFELKLGQYFEIVDIGGTATGEFTGLGEGARVNGPDALGLFITYVGGDGNDVGLYTVPEPACVSLMGLGALLLLRRRRRRDGRIR